MTSDRFVKNDFQFKKAFGPALLIFFILSFGATFSFAQELTVDFHVKKSITEDTDNYFLSGLISVNVDDDFNMYLSDYSQRVVFKVDSSGKYIDTIVKSGRGPGEVNSISSVMVDKSTGELIIADRQNARISKLDLEGNELAALNVDPGNMNMPVGMTEFINGNYLFLFSVSYTQNLRMEEGVDTFFHVYDLKSGERIQSFGNREQILDSLSYSNGIAAASTESSVGSATLLSDNQMLYAPHVYGGVMLEYRRDEEGVWMFSDKVSGTLLNRQIAIDFDFEDYMDNRQTFREETTRNISASMGSGINAAGIINYYSGGIYQTSDYVMHFYISEDKFEESFRHTLHVELFDASLTFLGSHKIFDGEAGEILGGGVTDIDREGNFYMPTRHFSQPEKNRVLVFELEITES